MEQVFRDVGDVQLVEQVLLNVGGVYLVDLVLVGDSHVCICGAAVHDQQWQQVDAGRVLDLDVPCQDLLEVGLDWHRQRVEGALGQEPLKVRA